MDNLTSNPAETVLINGAWRYLLRYSRESQENTVNNFSRFLITMTNLCRGHIPLYILVKVIDSDFGEPEHSP